MERITTQQALGRMVATRLDEAGITQRDAAEQTGIPLATLNRKLRNGDFKLSEFGAIAELLGTSRADLLAAVEGEAA